MRGNLVVRENTVLSSFALPEKLTSIRGVFAVTFNGALTALTLPAAPSSLGCGFSVSSNSELTVFTVPPTLAVWRYCSNGCPLIDPSDRSECGNKATLGLPDRIAAFADGLASSTSCPSAKRLATSNSCNAINLCDNANCELAPDSCHADRVCDPNSGTCIAPKADDTPYDNYRVCMAGVCTISCADTYGFIVSAEVLAASVGVYRGQRRDSGSLTSCH